jgi:hypothetical protein
MVRSKFKKEQVRDPEYGLQEELNIIKDNNTGLFNPSTMNNKNLHDLIRLLQDNNTTGFNSSTMNNKNLYDLIQQFKYGLYFQKNEDSNYISTTSTTFINRLSFTTSIIPAGKYVIHTCFNYYLEGTNSEGRVGLLIDGTDFNEVGWFNNIQYDINSVGQMESSFFIKDFTNEISHTIELQFLALDAAAPITLGNCKIFLHMVGD